jgi:DNA-binding MarR family transcriptional regulator
VAQNGDTVEATPSGTALYRRLNDEFTALSRQMYAGLGADELVTAQYVLSTIMARANDLLAR